MGLTKKRRRGRKSNTKKSKVRSSARSQFRTRISRARAKGRRAGTSRKRKGGIPVLSGRMAKKRKLAKLGDQISTSLVTVPYKMYMGSAPMRNLSLLPQTIEIDLPYYDQDVIYPLDSWEGNTYTVYYSINNVNDPYASFGGHQPRMYDQIKQFYGIYKVLKASVDVEFKLIGDAVVTNNNYQAFSDMVARVCCPTLDYANVLNPINNVQTTPNPGYLGNGTLLWDELYGSKRRGKFGKQVAYQRIVPKVGVKVNSNVGGTQRGNDAFYDPGSFDAKVKLDIDLQDWANRSKVPWERDNKYPYAGSGAAQPNEDGDYYSATVNADPYQKVYAYFNLQSLNIASIYSNQLLKYHAKVRIMQRVRFSLGNQAAPS